MTIRPVATPARTLYSGGSNSPTKTHWRGLAPKITKYSVKHTLWSACKTHLLHKRTWIMEQKWLVGHLRLHFDCKTASDSRQSQAPSWRRRVWWGWAWLASLWAWSLSEISRSLHPAPWCQLWWWQLGSRWCSHQHPEIRVRETFKLNWNNCSVVISLPQISQRHRKLSHWGQKT